VRKERMTIGDKFVPNMHALFSLIYNAFTTYILILFRYEAVVIRYRIGLFVADIHAAEPCIRTWHYCRLLL